MLTRRTIIFKTKPISFAFMISPFAERRGLELRLLVEEREAEDFNREGMMRTILNTKAKGLRGITIYV